MKPDQTTNKDSQQFLLAAGLSYEKGNRATNIQYTQMLIALAFDKIFFGATPTWLSFFGSCLILGPAIYVAVQKDTVKAKDPTHAIDLAGDEESQRGLMTDVEVEESEDHDRLPLEEVQMRTLTAKHT